MTAVDDLAPNYRIAAGAYHAWEMRDAQGELDDVVRAIFALPPGERPSMRLEALPLVMHVIPLVEVRGQRFYVAGTRRADGAWTTIHLVVPLPVP